MDVMFNMRQSLSVTLPGTVTGIDPTTGALGFDVITERLHLSRPEWPLDFVGRERLLLQLLARCSSLGEGLG